MFRIKSALKSPCFCQANCKLESSLSLLDAFEYESFIASGNRTTNSLVSYYTRKKKEKKEEKSGEEKFSSAILSNL